MLQPVPNEKPADVVKMDLEYRFRWVDRVRLLLGRRVKISLRAPTANKVELLPGPTAEMVIERFPRWLVLGAGGALVAGVSAALAWLALR
jgi:hypothetical protein